MSAAFSLDFSGDPVPCDFPGCVLDAYHDGDHSLFVPKPPERHFQRVCKFCHNAFVVYAGAQYLPQETCGSPDCILRAAKRDPITIPVLCTCAQRPYPHEVGIHAKIRTERPGAYLDYYDSMLRFSEPGMRWPWSLRFAPNMEAK
jgi:hypothetical protein